jgi:hypothetical protein
MNLRALNALEFKKVETGKGNPFREDKKVGSKYILKKKTAKDCTARSRTCNIHLQSLTLYHLRHAGFCFEDFLHTC